jgi:hypothetical protein
VLYGRSATQPTLRIRHRRRVAGATQLSLPRATERTVLGLGPRLDRSFHSGTVGWASLAAVTDVPLRRWARYVRPFGGLATLAARVCRPRGTAMAIDDLRIDEMVGFADGPTLPSGPVGPPPLASTSQRRHQLYGDVVQ